MSFPDSIARIRREFFKGMSRAIAVRTASMRIGHRTLRVPLLYGLGADHLGPKRRAWPLILMAHVVERWPGTVVDIGANVGLYLIHLKVRHPTCSYVGFEPNPACYYYLQELLVRNDLQPAAIFPLALSGRREFRRLYVKGHGDKMGSSDHNHRREIGRPRSLDLLVDAGDNVLSEIDTDDIVLVKIDVEGAEKEVLQGLEATLGRHRPIVVCEMTVKGENDMATRERRQRIEEILALLARVQYVCLAVTRDRAIKKCVSSEEIDSTQHHDRVLVPRNLDDDVLSMLKDCLRSEDR